MPTEPTAAASKRTTAKPAKAAAKKPAARRRPADADRRPRGRPTKIDQVVRQHPRTGAPMTVADVVIEALQAGNYVETAAGVAGVNKTTVYDWMREGARLSARVMSGDLKRLTAAQQRLVDFSHAVADAQAEAEARDVTTLAMLAQGGVKRTIVTEKQVVPASAPGATTAPAAPVVIERTVRTETTLPDAEAIKWRLERRNPKRWGRHVEVSGPDGGAIPLEVTVSAREALAEKLDQVAKRLASTPAPASPLPQPAEPTLDLLEQ